MNNPPQDLRWTCECDCPCMVLVEFAQEQMTPSLNLLCRPCLDGDHGQDDDGYGDARHELNTGTV